MISFESDYTTGAYPKLLQRLTETNMEVLSGYGNDVYCESARKKIQKECACPEADVFFLAGGTQNLMTCNFNSSSLMKTHMSGFSSNYTFIFPQHG